MCLTDECDGLIKAIRNIYTDQEKAKIRFRRHANKFPRCPVYRQQLIIYAHEGERERERERERKHDSY